MSAAALRRLAAGATVPRAEVPDLSWDDFAAALLDGVAEGMRVVAYFGAAEERGVRLYLVLADDARHELATGTTVIASTTEAPMANVFVKASG